MSAYLNIYLKDIEQDKYVMLDSYCGYFRDVFQSELNYNVKYDENKPLATLVSADDIRNIIEQVERDIQFSLDNISKAKKHIELISQMTDQSINNRLEAIQEEENYITDYQNDINFFQRVKNFYTVLLDLGGDDNRIYAGIDCYAPDGSDIELINKKLSIIH